MVNMIQDIKDLIEKYGFNQDTFDKAKLLFRNTLLNEEHDEVQLSIFKDKKAEEYVDGHIDLMVISIGNLLLAGVDVEKAWNEVHRANMSKVRGIKPGRESSGGFDIIKPEGWVGPDHSDNHGLLGNILKND